MQKEVAIIGGGIVGVSTAYNLLKKHSDLRITIIEKEDEIGKHQSSHNSGVIHCGLAYKPDSLKAKLTSRGTSLLKEFADEHNIPYDQCGKLVVATSVEEVPALNKLYDQGRKNGLKDLKLLNQQEAKEIEPHVKAVAALHVPEEGIIDYKEVIMALKKCIVNANGRFLLNTTVENIYKKHDKWTIKTQKQDFHFDYIINCCGLFSDKVAKLTGKKSDVKIIPFRGDYYRIKPERKHLVKNLIYPVPEAKFPFLGVHFTRTMAGHIECGPNAVLATAREGYKLTDFSFSDIWDTLTYVGFWRFVFRYPTHCFREFGSTLLKRVFYRRLKKMIPELKESDLESGGVSGVRAQAVTKQGELLMDFLVMTGDGDLHVLNAPSPAATASLAIGEYITNKWHEAFASQSVSQS